MVPGERLVVGAVARRAALSSIDDEPRVLPADAARRLDVLRGALGLAHDHHQAEAVDVDADRDHVRGEDDV